MLSLAQVCSPTAQAKATTAQVQRRKWKLLMSRFQRRIPCISTLIHGSSLKSCSIMNLRAHRVFRDVLLVCGTFATAANLSYSNNETLRFPLAFDALITPHELQMPYPLSTGLRMTRAGRPNLPDIISAITCVDFRLGSPIMIGASTAANHHSGSDVGDASPTLLRGFAASR